MPCTCNVFTSTAGIKSLFSLEKTTASLLQQYISTQEQTLQALRELASQLESTDIPPSDTLMRPSDSFGVINRLVSSLDKINKSIHSQVRWPFRAPGGLAGLLRWLCQAGQSTACAHAFRKLTPHVAGCCRSALACWS